MTQTNAHPASEHSVILRGAVTTGVISGLINGVIPWCLLRGLVSIPPLVNGITNDEQTVFGLAVPLAVSLAMILTVIAYFTLKAPKKRFMPQVLWLTIKHGIFVFGLCVAAAVVWQRVMGTVSLATAVVVLSTIAGIVAGIINPMTIRACVQHPA